MKTNRIKKEQEVLIHDDILATEETVKVAADLVRSQGGEVT